MRINSKILPARGEITGRQTIEEGLDFDFCGLKFALVNNGYVYVYDETVVAI